MKKSCVSSVALWVGLLAGIGYAQQGSNFSVDSQTIPEKEWLCRYGETEQLLVRDSFCGCVP